MSDKKIVFWDTCVFVRFLSKKTESTTITSEETIYKEAEKRGKFEIWSSAILWAEFCPYKNANSMDSYNEIVTELQSTVQFIDTTPHICQLAGMLRDIRYQKSGSSRSLSVGDALFLATYLFAEKEMGLPLSEFHTYDRGNKKNSDDRVSESRRIGQKTVPLIGLDQWLQVPDTRYAELSRRVMGITICEPWIQQTELF